MISNTRSERVNENITFMFVGVSVIERLEFN